MQNPSRKILLNPGPATTTDTVKAAMVVPDICPREKEFGDLMQEISKDLTILVGDMNDYVTVLFGGSGTAAVEAMLSSVLGPDDCLLVINNGAYGARMLEIAEIYGMEVQTFAGPPDVALDLAGLESALESSIPGVTHLAMVHNETTTGLLNNVAAVGDICRKRGIVLMVDAMSSFGAIPLDMRSMSIRFLAASANKNLQGMAGVSFVIAERSSLELLRDLRPRNLYLNLYRQYQGFAETGQMRFTPPVQTLYALKQALFELKIEGCDRRYARYSESWRTLIRGIRELGLKHLVDEKDHSRIVTAIVEPEHPGYDFRMMHDYLLERGFTIYPGKIGSRGTFRVANIGDIGPADMKAFLGVLRNYFKEIGYIS